MDDQNTGAPRVSRYETGKHEPDQETMTQIAEALGLPVAYFHAVDDILAEVILLVAKMPKQEREEILDRFGVCGCYCSNEDDCFTELNRDSAVSLFGDLAGFNRDGSRSDLERYFFWHISNEHCPLAQRNFSEHLRSGTISGTE